MCYSVWISNKVFIYLFNRLFNDQIYRSTIIRIGKMRDHSTRTKAFRQRSKIKLRINVKKIEIDRLSAISSR